MRFVVAAIGRLKSGPERELAERYRKRAADAGRKIGIRDVEIIEIRESRARELDRRVLEDLHKAGNRSVRVEGMPLCDWVLIDAGDVIVHVFRPEARAFYSLEKMWAGGSAGKRRAS